MSGRISNSVANALLNSVFGRVSYTAPSTLYVGLSTTPPNNDGTNITEPSGNGYTRVAVTNNTTNWPNASGRSKVNGATITFPAATGVWGTVSYAVIMDASSGGNMLAWFELATPQSIVIGNSPDFTVGSLTISAPGS